MDQQLRGRAGRQGDPGESRFFISLEDDLLVRYGIAELIPQRLRPSPSDAPLDNPVIRREVARAQRIVDGQNLEIRRTLARYAAVLEDQHRLLSDRRQAVLTGEDASRLWQREPRLREALATAAGERAVVEAERLVTLACIDAAWRDHLARCADVREGIHLVRLGGQDPLTVYTREAIEASVRMDAAIDEAVLAALPRMRVVAGRVDLSAAGIKLPSATWTYLVNDDPFRNRIGALLTGPGGATIAMYAAAVLSPLLILWGVIERVAGRRGERRSDLIGR